MPRIDDQLRDALNAEDRALLDKLGSEPGILELWRETYRGKLFLLNVFATIVSFAMFAVQIWMLVKLLTTDDPVLSVRYAVGFLFCAMGVGMLKMWFWLRMNHLAAIREIKRIELLLARKYA